MNEREQFYSQVKLVLKPALVADGFRGSGTTYRRILGDVIHVFALQGPNPGSSSYAGQCCVCLGIHLAFLPTVVPREPAKLTEPDCEFRTRLAPPGREDCWWPYGSTDAEARASAESILRLYREVGAPYFARFSTFPADFVRVTPDMLGSSEPLPFPACYTAGRRALALTRIALRAGSLEDAKRFAAFGLAHISPLATGLKAEFQSILSTNATGIA